VKDDDANETQNGAFVRALQRVVVIEPRELRSIAWSLLYFFSLLASAFVLRPLRDSMGLNGGPDKYPLLFTGTLVAMIVVSPPFALLVTKLPRKRFIPIVYRVSMLCLFAFWLWLKLSPGSMATTRCSARANASGCALSSGPGVMLSRATLLALQLRVLPSVPPST